MQAGMRMSNTKAQTSLFGRLAGIPRILVHSRKHGRIAGIQRYYVMQLDIGAGGSEALKFYSFSSARSNRRNNSLASIVRNARVELWIRFVIRLENLFRLSLRFANLLISFRIAFA